MDKELVKENLNEDKNNLTWDTAIADSEEMIRQYRMVIAELKDSIRVFKQRRDDNEPLPGSLSATRNGAGCESL